MRKKKLGYFSVAFVCMLMATTFVFAANKGNNVMRKTADGTTIVNTSSLCPNVRGFRGPTPLEVYFKKGKVLRVVALPNQETPKYFQKVKTELLGKWNGMTAAKASKANIDGVTGATFSSKAVKANVKAAEAYYKTHK